MGCRVEGGGGVRGGASVRRNGRYKPSNQLRGLEMLMSMDRIMSLRNRAFTVRTLPSEYRLDVLTNAQVRQCMDFWTRC